MWSSKASQESGVLRVMRGQSWGIQSYRQRKGRPQDRISFSRNQKLVGLCGSPEGDVCLVIPEQSHQVTYCLNRKLLPRARKWPWDLNSLTRQPETCPQTPKRRPRPREHALSNIIYIICISQKTQLLERLMEGELAKAPKVWIKSPNTRL